ncbi:xanthine permease [Halobacteriales archaeon QS_1_68_20]|nr:MAG: xanthine permease [Halobacteriales archaeon QS_1_68_20]
MTDEDTPDDSDGTTPAAAEGDPAPVEESDFVEYGIEDKPPLGESILLGVQHYLTMIGATIAIPLALIATMNGVEGVSMPTSAQAQLIGTFFVVSGIATLAQTTIGNRYPIVQGGTFSMLAPAVAIIAAVGAQGAGYEIMLRELQGAIIVAALVEVVIGYGGVMGWLKRYMSPVVIAPVIALIGLALFNTPQIVDPGDALHLEPGSNQNWWLLGLTVLLIVGFSQYLDKYSRYARLFPVLLGVGAAWAVAAVLTVAGVLEPASISGVNFEQVASASAIQPITPLQWGMPQFTTAFAIGMFAGVVASMIESFGDYHAVARLAGISAPSRKRVNHGIGMEGLGNVFAGIMGTGNGSTSYSENIGAIGITGVASRYVVRIGAVVMIVVGYVGYFGQLVATIPTPIVGGLFIAMFGQIAAVGLANLKYVDLDSSRNVFIIGLALFAGLAIPEYMAQFPGPDAFREGMSAFPAIGSILGSRIVSDTVFVVGSTGMAVGGIIAFVLDNTVEGTREERGLEQWKEIAEDEEEFQSIFDRLGDGTDERPAGGAD